MYNMVSILIWEDESGHIDYQTGFKLLHKAYELGADWAAEELGFAYNGCPNEQYRDVIRHLNIIKKLLLKALMLPPIMWEELISVARTCRQI